MKNNEIATSTAGKRGRWGQERRLEFIDSRLYWEGRLNRPALTEFFGISVQQASLDLAEYMRLAPGNTMYDTSQKTYLATEQFQPAFTDPSSARYLAELYALTTGVLTADLSFLGWTPPADIVRHPTRLVPHTVLRQTLAAVRERRCLKITYQAMGRPDPTERVISPHAMGYDGYRWHVRGYCHLRNEYRDFVFARILALSLAEPSQVQSSDDIEWHRILEVIIAPNPALPEAPKRVIALDYGMVDGQLILRTRQALAFYLLKRLGLTQTPAPDRAHEQQIVLVNRDALIPYLPQLATNARE
jgi:hypothetical protein